jgi:transposase InsO family protein
VGRDQVARLMRGLGITGVVRGKVTLTTTSDPRAERAPDLVERRFVAKRPHQLWVADFTYATTWAHTVYVAFVIDDRSSAPIGHRLRPAGALCFWLRRSLWRVRNRRPCKRSRRSWARSCTRRRHGGHEVGVGQFSSVRGPTARRTRGEEGDATRSPGRSLSPRQAPGRA